MMGVDRRRAVLALAAGLLLAAAPAPVRRRYVDGPMGQLHVRMAGPARRTAAPPLLCLHQTALSGQMFEAFMGVIGRSRPVIAFDTPGYGQSAAPAARPAIAGYGAALIAGMDALKLRTVDLIGYHTGTVMAAEIARARPRQVRKMVLVSVPLFAAERRAQIIAGMDSVPAWDEAGSALMRQWTSSVASRGPGQTIDHLRRTLAQKLQAEPASADWAVRSLLDYPLEVVLAGLNQPSLVIPVGDSLQGPTMAAARLMRHAQVRDMPEIANGLFDAAPDRLAEVISAFLDA